MNQKHHQESSQDCSVLRQPPQPLMMSIPCSSRAHKKHCKAERDYCKKECVSESIYSITLKKGLSPCQVVVPKVGPPVNLQVVCNRKYQPYVVLKYHSLEQRPYTLLATQFSEMVQDLYVMANNGKNLNKTNKNTKTGSMSGIGFCQGTDQGYSAGNWESPQTC